jgi:hypothetical protein
MIQCSSDRQLSTGTEIWRFQSNKGIFMDVQRRLLAIALAGTFAASSAVYAAGVRVDVDIAPPAPLYEQMPARQGYIVAPGYYRYDTKRHEHVWVKSTYKHERHGEHFVASDWKEHDGRYQFSEGRWEHDK